MMSKTIGEPDGPSVRVVQELLERLRAERTVLRLISAERHYERLALITHLNSSPKRPLLHLGPAPGFPDDFRHFDAGRVEVQFLGENHMPYRFESDVAERTADGLWVAFPAAIEAARRRRFPRVTPPARTSVRFVAQGRSIAATMANMGAGGALVLLDEPLKSDLRVRSGAVLEDLHMSCAAKTLRFDVTVKRSLVRRGQGEMQPDFFSVALQFVEMNPRNHRRLESAIGACRQAELARTPA